MSMSSDEIFDDDLDKSDKIQMCIRDRFRSYRETGRCDSKGEELSL